MTINGCVFQNSNFCFIKICFQTQGTSFFDYSFEYFITSISLNLKSLRNPFRKAALNSHVWWSTSCLSFLNFFEACVMIEDSFLLNSNYLLSILLSLSFFVEREIITEKINSLEKRQSSVHRFNILKKMEYFLRQHSITFFTSERDYIHFFSLAQLPCGAKLIVKLQPLVW